jgi:hypothetical protein
VTTPTAENSLGRVYSCLIDLVAFESIQVDSEYVSD